MCKVRRESISVVTPLITAGRQMALPELSLVVSHPLVVVEAPDLSEETRSLYQAVAPLLSGEAAELSQELHS